MKFAPKAQTVENAGWPAAEWPSGCEQGGSGKPKTAERCSSPSSARMTRLEHSRRANSIKERQTRVVTERSKEGKGIVSGGRLERPVIGLSSRRAIRVARRIQLSSRLWVSKERNCLPGADLPVDVLQLRPGVPGVLSRRSPRAPSFPPKQQLPEQEDDVALTFR